MIGVGIEREHLMELEFSPIVFEDLELVREKLGAEQMQSIIKEEGMFTILGEGDRAVATDLIEDRKGASEEGEEGQEVDHLELMEQFIIFK